MEVTIKYANHELKGEVVGESNEPVYDEDGKLIYNIHTVTIKIKDGDDPVPK